MKKGEKNRKGDRVRKKLAKKARFGSSEVGEKGHLECSQGLNKDGKKVKKG